MSRYGQECSRSVEVSAQVGQDGGDDEGQERAGELLTLQVSDQPCHLFCVSFTIPAIFQCRQVQVRVPAGANSAGHIPGNQRAEK